MAEYRITVCGKDGPTALAGEFSPGPGVVHLRPDLPQGEIGEITAAIPLTLGEGEKIFLNGYQTWTYCPEYTRDGHIRGIRGIPKFLLKKYGFDRYGDYHFVPYPNRRGILHGESWCYFRQAGEYRLIASLDERPGYTIFQYDAGAGVLSLRRDCAGVRCGGPYPAFDLFFAQGTEEEVFDAWFAALGIAPRTAEKIAGYSSWYNRYEDISQDTIRSDLAGWQGLLEQGDLFQIDDGWESAVGDWLEPDSGKFPGGMKAMADEIHAAGFQAGLWLAPFAAARTSQVFREHPDWLLRQDGEPWFAGGNWGGFYALDIDNPQVQDYLMAVFHRVLEEWGFDLVKLDFLYAAAPFGSRQESRAGRMYRAMELLRSLAGEKKILGCGVPVMPAFGLADYCRVGCDVSLDWNDRWYMRAMHLERVSTWHCLANTLYRRQLNGRAYGSDPDVFFLRRDNIRLTEGEKEALAKADALLGSVFLSSDDPAAYTPEQRAQYAALRRLRSAQNVRVDPGDPRILRYTLDSREESVTLPLP